MKTLSKHLLLGLLMSNLLLISCKKDTAEIENVITKKSFLKIGDKEYNLAKGAFLNDGKEDSSLVYFHELAFFSDSFSLTTSQFGEMEISGSGQLIYFDLYSSMGEQLDEGDYMYSSESGSFVKTFDYGAYFINYSSDNTENEEVEIISGTLSVSKTDGEYSITINCMSEDGEIVTGFFNGKLEYFVSIFA